MLTEGQAAPDFDLPADDGSRVRLGDLRGQKIVLYFYPKDGTSGCAAPSGPPSHSAESGNVRHPTVQTASGGSP